MNDIPRPGEPRSSGASRIGPEARRGLAGSDGRVVLGVSLILIALNLRAAAAGVGPLLREIVHALHLSAPSVSIFASLPTLLFGAAAPVAPFLARRLGTERALLIALVLLSVGCAVRGFGAAPALFAGQITAMAGIGLLNVLLPGFVKREFPDQVGLMTGLYTTAFCIGAAGAAALAVPLANWFGGSWRPALSAWALPAAFATLVWAVQLRPGHGASPAGAPHFAGVWRDAIAWQLLLFMGLQSALAYIVFSWLPAMLQDRGLSSVDAGFVLSLSAVAQGIACLAAPAVAIRGRDQRAVTVGSVALSLLGLAGCFLFPLPTIWAWAVLLGLSQGALIALALTLIVLRSGSPQATASLSGMAQCGGYLLASAGPIVAGLLHEGLGGWFPVFLFCVALCAAAAAAGYGASRDRLVGGRRNIGG